MRARAGLASCSCQLGQRTEAIAHCKQMLDLNPSDSQGLRYLLLTCLFEQGLYSDVEELLNANSDEISADWQYTRALLLFHPNKTSNKALVQLGKAISCDPPYFRLLNWQQAITPSCQITWVLVMSQKRLITSWNRVTCGCVRRER